MKNDPSYEETNEAWDEKEGADEDGLEKEGEVEDLDEDEDDEDEDEDEDAEEVEE